MRPAKHLITLGLEGQQHHHVWICEREEDHLGSVRIQVAVMVGNGGRWKMRFEVLGHPGRLLGRELESGLA